MPKKAEAKKPEPAPAPVAEPAPVNETYQVIKRNDAWVVELTLFGKVWHDERTFPYKHDAEKRMQELAKHLK